MAEENAKATMTEQEYLAQKYGDYFVHEDDRFERTVEDRHGNEVKVFLREFSESDLELREEVMIDQSGVMRNASSKNSRRRRNRGVPDIKVKPSNRRKFDIVKGVDSWELTDFKRTKDGGIVFKQENGEDVVDEEGYRIPEIVPVECSTREKLRLKGYMSEQMVKLVRELNDLPIEEEDEDEDDIDEKDEPTAEEVAFFENLDTSDFDDVDELPEQNDNVTPLAEASKSRKPKGKSGSTSKSKQSSGSSS